MAVYYRYIHRAPRRGAVMIYALVFAITAAVTLYVASSIYQARQRANNLRAYADQRTMARWNLQYVLRGAQQNSLDAGVGLVDEDAWNTVTLPVGGAASYAGAPGSTPAQMNPRSLADAWVAVWAARTDVRWGASSTSRLQYSWAVGTVPWLRTTADNAAIDLSAGSNGREFTVSDLLTIPGWKPRRNNETGNANFVALRDLNETDQQVSNRSFILTADTSYFPAALRGRGDLPFDEASWVTLTNPPGNIVNVVAPNSYARWVRDTLNVTLTPKTGANEDAAASAALGAQTISAFTWAVEEPITNYQLLLLDPQGDNTWPGGGVLAGNIQFRAASVNATGGLVQVFRPKALVWGNVAANFTNVVAGGPIFQSLPDTQATYPLLAVVRGRLLDTSTNQFDWRLARPSTQISFGRAPGSATGPTAFPSLPEFLLSNVVDAANPGDVTFERQLELRNAQAVSNPVTPASPADARTFCYVNSVLSMSATGGVQWSAQSSVAANNSVMGGGNVTPGGPGSGAPYQLPLSANASTRLFWVFQDDRTAIVPPALPTSWASNSPQQVQLYYGDADGSGNIWSRTPSATPPIVRLFDNSGNTTTNNLGVSAINYFSTSTSTWSLVTIDLSLVGLQNLTATGGGGTPPSTPAWASPTEVHVTNNNPSNRLYVRLIGDARPMAAASAPVKIVVSGANEVRLLPDNSAIAVAGVGNYRRMILVVSNGTASTNLALDTARVAGGGSICRWYGVLIAPYGIDVACYTATPGVSGGIYFTGTPDNNGVLQWQGTILAGRRLSVNNGTLRLAPDEGDAGNGTTTTNMTSTLFLPQYNSSMPLGRPVPMLVPRLLWTFE